MTTYKLDPLVNGLPFPTNSSFTVANDVNADGLIAGFAVVPDDAPTPANRVQSDICWTR